ncbi:hypothetical protein J1N35_002023 [Gossypium stocksii]|uniref:Aminotransferase-like plant mobile domain-containing protein n=1 Tax=Gossypium stocksii TaxID=47602 RepID=A0A9D3WJT6_9ROSI|nr:hypothetical protein J1N35_002023 [Gossypium stocksii]
MVYPWGLYISTKSEILTMDKAYSCRSAVLAMLYPELCRAIKHETQDISATTLGIKRSETMVVYHQMIKAQSGCNMSYSREEVAAVIPTWVHQQQLMWKTNTSLVNFSTVEWHNADRLLRQFRCIQHILNDPKRFDNVHDINKRGKDGKN